MREPGFYWVRVRLFAGENEEPSVGLWQPDAFGGPGWEVCGYSSEYPDNEVEVLSERLVPPS